jgi:hypothetical protein
MNASRERLSEESPVAAARSSVVGEGGAVVAALAGVSGTPKE